MKELAELTRQANKFLSSWGISERIVVGEDRAPVPIYWGGNGLGRPSLFFKFERWEIAAYFNGDRQVVVTDWYSVRGGGKVAGKLSDTKGRCYVIGSQGEVYFSLPFLLALRAYTIYLQELGTSYVFYSLQPTSITLEWFVGERLRSNAFKAEISVFRKMVNFKRLMRRARLFVNQQEVTSGKVNDILKMAAKAVACFKL